MAEKKENIKFERGKQRESGDKGDIFFDSIDYNILALTQSEFKSGKQIAGEMNITFKNLYPHIMKLVDIGLLDGVFDKEKKQYVFTCYFKITGKENEWGFQQQPPEILAFINAINTYIQKLKFNEAMDKLKTSETTPEIKKK